jgi:seryl-tRNA synthetase
MAYTPCYRREAGSAGRDTRGMLRSHEFDKVEILALSTADQAPGLLEEMVGRVEATIAALELPYRIIEICTGDMGQSHHRSFDIEVYAPGADQWLEVSSISWFSDYQARRANIRYRPLGPDGKPQKGTQLVHTLNGSALAVPRVWAAIVENYRNADGSITVPTALHPYMRGITTIS